jgi:hypothetical protein
MTRVREETEIPPSGHSAQPQAAETPRVARAKLLHGRACFAGANVL